ncbi:BTAD domain-containing putative transcriptional regulator [Fodinicola feengrottensis]|uniref:BTAD domain-containing putative transcriptional regulator n=2 Tax=Fodinicola feengrottensis TaxID=435914 RepID=A0ABN2I9X9_9ACTN
MDGTRLIQIRQPRQRALLTALLVRPGQIVPADSLIERLWPQMSLVHARRALHTAISRLRQVLGDTDSILIRTQTPGYLIDVSVEQLDTGQFEGLLQRAAHHHADPAARGELLAAALRLWRGPLLADVDVDLLSQDELVGITERRELALEWRIQADLETGKHAAMIPELSQLTTEFPARERFWEHLMVALYRVGRQAEALEAYQTARRRLAETLGIEPSAALRTLEKDILNHADWLAAPAGGAEHPWRLQRQLPLRDPLFSGRTDLIASIACRLTRLSKTVSIVAVHGGPGVGKSAFALQVAHDVTRHFPDGQWYVRLDGAGRAPRDPAEVLAELLSSSGLHAASIPAGLDARAAAWRTRIADRRVLLVLDDARSVEQIEPLLPGAPGSAVLVTSRTDLRALRVSAGAVSVPLDILTAAEARALLRAALDAPDACGTDIDDLTEICAMLPLALRIAAANLASRPGHTAGQLVAELRAGDLLGQLAVVDDQRAAVRAAFQQSYQRLDPVDATLFRRLGLVPGPHVTAEGAASLLATSADVAAHRLDVLATASLLQHHEAGRYRLHDLLRRYAGEQAEKEDTATDREQARDRWYADLLARTRAAVLIGHQNPHFACPSAARGWLDAERPTLVAAARVAGQLGPLPMAWRLASAAAGYLSGNNHSEEWRSVVTDGLRAARKAGVVPAQAEMEVCVALLETNAGRYDLALQHYERSLRLRQQDGQDLVARTPYPRPAPIFVNNGTLADAVAATQRGIAAGRRYNDVYGMAGMLAFYAMLLLDQGKISEALDHLRQAAAIRRTAGGDGATAHELCLQGACLFLLGRAPEALEHLTVSYRLSQLHGDRPTEACVLLTRAEMAASGGHFDEAVSLGRQAVAVAENCDSHAHIDALGALGRAHLVSGEHTFAIEVLGRAWALADAHGHRRPGLQARTRLAAALVAAGQLSTAAVHVGASLRACGDHGYRLQEAIALTVLAELRLAEGDFAAAAEQSQRALNLQQSLGCLAGVRSADAVMARVRQRTPVERSLSLI